VERVHPEDIKTTALLSIEGELDDISGSGQTAAVHTICAGVDAARQQHIEVEGAGHYGIFAGRRWRETVYPQVKAFILKYQLGAAAAGTPPPTPPARATLALVPAAKSKAAAKPKTVKATPADPAATPDK